MIMAVSTISLCCLFLLGAVCLTSAIPYGPEEQYGDAIDRAVMAAKDFGPALPPGKVKVRCCSNCPRCSDEVGMCNRYNAAWCVVCSC